MAESPMAEDQFQILRGGRLLDARARTLEPRDILLEGDVIREVGPPGLAAPEAAAVVEAGQAMLMPGLINAHTHSHGALGKGRGDLWTLELLLNAGSWINAERQSEEIYASTLLNTAEMIRRGCTATYDLVSLLPAPTTAGLKAVFQAYDDAGFRALVAPMLADTAFYDAVPGLLESLPEALQKEVDRFRPGSGAGPLAVCRELLSAWPYDRQRLAMALAPTIPLLCSEDFLIGCRDLAEEQGVGIHTHLAESKIQALAGLERYGKTLCHYFDSLGLINERFTGAHGVWLDDDDMARLADRGASVAANPGSNLRLGSGLPALKALARAGVNVAIGSDGSNSADNQNMFEALRYASYVSRVQSHDVQDWLTTEQVVRMGTEGGARAMGLEGVTGRLEAGYKADIVFLDLADITYLPLNDPFNQLVHCDDGGTVERVMIGGRLVYQAGQFLTIDVEKLRGQVTSAWERLREVTDWRREVVQKLEGLVGHYCACYAARPYHIGRMGFAPQALCDKHENH